MAKYIIMNETDGVPAGMHEFSTKKRAQEHINAMRTAFKNTQGYYRTNKGEKISPDAVEYRIIRISPNPESLAKSLIFTVSNNKKMKTKLPYQIATIAAAKKFLTALHDNGEAYHPEDDATDLSGDPFTMKEGNQLNKLMNDIYNLNGNNDNHRHPVFDPCGWLYALRNIEEKLELIEPTQRIEIDIISSTKEAVIYKLGPHDTLTIPREEFANYIYYGGYISRDSFARWQDIHSQIQSKF